MPGDSGYKFDHLTVAGNVDCAIYQDAILRDVQSIADSGRVEWLADVKHDAAVERHFTRSTARPLSDYKWSPSINGRRGGELAAEIRQAIAGQIFNVAGESNGNDAINW